MKKATYAALLLALLTCSCALGQQGNRRFQAAETQFAESGTSGASDTATPVVTDTPFPTDTPTPIPVPTLTGTPTPQMFPMVTFAQNANCRKGPGKAYYSVAAYNKGDTAEADGRNEDGTWLWIRMSNDRDYCWVFTQTVEEFGDVNVLRVVVYQTLPDTPAWISVTKKICSGGGNILRIDWEDVQGEQGYRLYHGGELIGTLPPATTFALDYPRNAKNYVYSVEAFNEYGVSQRITVTEPGC